MQKARRFLFFAILPLLGLGASPQEEEKVSLSWKFAKDQRDRFEYSQKVRALIDHLEMEQEVLFGLRWETLEVSESGDASIRIFVDRMKIRMTGPQEVDYDSDRDPAPPHDTTARLMAGFRGNSFRMELSPQGEIREILDLEEVIEKILDALQEEATGEMMREMFRRQFNGTIFQKNLQEAFALLPPAPVGKGARWESRTEFPLTMGGRVAIQSLSTLQDLPSEAGEAPIQVSETVNFIETEESELTQLVELRTAVGSKEVRWNVTAGRINSVHSVLDLGLRMSNQDIQMTITTSLAHSPRSPKDALPKDEKPKEDGSGGK